MQNAFAIVAIWLASASACLAQNCVISGGTNFGSIIQNCYFAPPPLSIISKEFENTRLPNGSFQHQIFVQIGQPVTLLLIACGDGVVDVDGSPWPAGMTSESEKMTHENCVAHRLYNAAPGRWALWVTTAREESKFTLQPIIE